MLKVYEKNDQEILDEVAAKREACADLRQARRNARKYVGAKVCRTYIVDEQGNKIDTNQLNEMQIMALTEKGIYQNAKELALSHNEQREADHTAIDETKRLMVAVRDQFQPSLASLKNIVSMYYSKNLLVRDAAQQVYGYTLDNSTTFQTSWQIAQFEKESRGDFNDKNTPLYLPDVIDQMIENENRRQKYQANIYQRLDNNDHIK